ncbi:MAG: urate hydroxylase PuuD [Deltaproteobacteria bacterium]|nr:urate hydroxylase PuuD [Deltaproteobacteria bacterium]
MKMALFNMDGILFLLRWIHFIFGVIWIGLLYYFNFIQGEFFKEIEAGVKNIATQKLVPRALGWFRWGAMVTFLSGLFILTGTLHAGMPWHSSWFLLILIGAGFGTLMWFNVWFVIWPNQKTVIASANQVLSGGKPLEKAAVCGARALCASRTNVVFSFPMLFFMGAARHLGFDRDFSTVNFWPIGIVIALLALLLQINALKGKPGPMASVKGVIHVAVIFTAVVYLAVEFLSRI